MPFFSDKTEPPNARKLTIVNKFPAAQLTISPRGGSSSSQSLGYKPYQNCSFSRGTQPHFSLCTISRTAVHVSVSMVAAAVLCPTVCCRHVLKSDGVDYRKLGGIGHQKSGRYRSQEFNGGNDHRLKAPPPTLCERGRDVHPPLARHVPHQVPHHVPQTAALIM